MAGISRGHDMEVALLNALGLREDRRVRKVVISFEVGRPPLVTVEFYVHGEEERPLIQVFEGVRFEPV